MLAALLAPAESRADIVSACAKLLAPKPWLSHKAVVQLQTHSDNQTADRGLIAYQKLVRTDSVLQANRLNPDFHWMDVGGGVGLAALESFYFESSVDWEMHSRRGPWELSGRHRATVISVQDLFTKYFYFNPRLLDERVAVNIGKWLEARDRLTASGQYRYLTGKFFEDPAMDENLEPADLITDVFGAFSYSENKFEILVKMFRLLKPGGRIRIFTHLPIVEIFDGEGVVRNVPLEQYLKLHPIPGMQAYGGDKIVIKPEPGTLAGLEALAATLEFSHVEKGHLPNLFYYRTRR